MINLEYFEGFVKVSTAAFTAFNFISSLVMTVMVLRLAMLKANEMGTKKRPRENNGTMSSKRFVVVLLLFTR
ncbi:MAG: hypothetical protein ACJAW8_001049 [Oleispira sp.]|mgnify:CR=1|jgi:hypothetical protein|tara:strand:+ start:5672 stop:5887 length:216 start_codon:yes stop_codon:yes gene_type:complete